MIDVRALLWLLVLLGRVIGLTARYSLAFVEFGGGFWGIDVAGCLTPGLNQVPADIYS